MPHTDKDAQPNTTQFEVSNAHELPQTTHNTTKVEVHSSAQVLPQTPHATIEVQAQNSANKFTEFTEDITNNVTKLVDIDQTDLQQVLNQKDIMQ